MDDDARPTGAVPPTHDPLQMTVSRTRLGKDAGVRVSGEIDMLTAPTLLAFILAAVEDSPSGLGVDLTDVAFLDSSGVQVLVQAAAQATLAGTSFYLLCPPGNAVVRRVLDILQVGSVITIVERLAGPPASPIPG